MFKFLEALHSCVKDVFGNAAYPSKLTRGTTDKELSSNALTCEEWKGRKVEEKTWSLF
jgi:hypothetical protein